jgi:hypothetical protein
MRLSGQISRQSVGPASAGAEVEVVAATEVVVALVDGVAVVVVDAGTVEVVAAPLPPQATITTANAIRQALIARTLRGSAPPRGRRRITTLRRHDSP